MASPGDVFVATPQRICCSVIRSEVLHPTGLSSRLEVLIEARAEANRIIRAPIKCSLHDDRLLKSTKSYFRYKADIFYDGTGQVICRRLMIWPDQMLQEVFASDQWPLALFVSPTGCGVRGTCGLSVS